MKITKSAIILDRELSELDNFAVNFCKAISKKTNYVLVSGYVSILLGRARASEDIDMIIPKMSTEKWKSVYEHLLKSGYYCLNASDSKSSFELLNDKIAVRFASEGVVIPNMEILFALVPVQKMTLSSAIKVKIGKETLHVSNLELQIAYKEKALGSPKDLEDARHLRLILGSNLNIKKLREFEKMIK